MANIKVFVSYSRDDSDSVQVLFHQLRDQLREKSGVDLIWIDPFAPGVIPLSADWRAEIRSKIQACDVVIAIVSPASAESDQIMDELNETKRLGKPNLMVILKPSDLPDAFRRDFGVLDIRDTEQIAHALLQITSRIPPPDSVSVLSVTGRTVPYAPSPSSQPEAAYSSMPPASYVQPPAPQASVSPAPASPPAPANSPMQPPVYAVPPPAAPAPSGQPAPLAPVVSESRFGSAPSADDVFFTAYYPRMIQSQRRYGLFVYAHLESALAQIAKDVEKFKAELGDQIPAPKTAKKSANLKIGTPITITPECDENAITFDPPSLTKKWEADWKRFEFDFKPSADLIGETISGRIIISAYGIEQASIKFAFEVMPSAKSDPGQKSAEGLLAAAKLAATPTTGLYQHIFVSYSRKDRAVAEAYRKAQIARGDDVFMDTYSIRVGENWQAALAHAIEKADVFQLFWSKNSAASENVRHEWIHALNSRCSDSDCAAFIRPIFWVEPMPAPPPKELSERKINFRYVSLLTESGLFGRLKKLFGGQ